MVLKIEYLDPIALKPYENNARAHKEQDVSAIVKSIQEFGFNDPIGIWGKENLIVEGHGRLQAALRLGMDKVPCIRLDELTDEQRRAYALAHNKTAELSAWDFDILDSELKKIAEIDMSAFGFEIADDSEAIDDEYDVVLPEEPKSKPGQIYRLGKHRLMCGDATRETDVDRLCVCVCDLYLTDPPYNVDYTGGTDEHLKIANDFMPKDEFRSFLTKAFNVAETQLKPGGAFYIWYSSAATNEFMSAAEEAKLTVHQILIWNKNTFVLGRQDYHWKHEPCLYGWKEGAHYFIEDRTQSTVFEDKLVDIEKMKKDELKDLVKELLKTQVPVDVLDEKKPFRSAEHPTMKPVPLIGTLIKNSTRPGEVVLDTFAGSGSTIIACEQLGRTCYSMELDPRFVDVIIERWENYTGQKAELIGG